MKKAEELFAEIVASEELKAKYVEAVESDKVDEFLKDNGCDVTADAWTEYMKSLLNTESMSLDDMDQVAGGTLGDMDVRPITEVDDLKFMRLSSVNPRAYGGTAMMTTLANPFYTPEGE